jgi:hypothetical protein
MKRFAAPGPAHAANINGTCAMRYTTFCQAIDEGKFSLGPRIRGNPW